MRKGTMERTQFMRACAGGGQDMADAMRRLLADYGGALQREGMACLGRAEDACDLVQLTLIKAWRHCAGFRGDSELFPWLKSMLRHAAIDQLRRQRPEQPLTSEDESVLPEVERALQALAEDGGPEGHALRAQMDAVFRRCAERFSAEQPQAAQVIRWISEDGLTPAEIAPLIGRSAGATREYLSQCRKKARLYFADWYRLAAATPEDLVQ